MKKVLSVILAVLLMISVIPTGLFSITASAATSGYYTYTVSNREATITSVNTSISGNVTIPTTLGGYPVTSIGDDAFSNCRSLTSITIPDSVTSIGHSAFYDCESLTSVTIPDSVTSIGNDAFCYCTSLTSVIIGNSVTSIGFSAFSGCTSLTNITVDASNRYYSSVDGVLFNKNKTELVCYPAGKTNTSYAIPDSVTSIGFYAFRDCTSLENITIPDSVTSIDSSAFYNTGYYNDSSNWENSVLYIGKHLIDAKNSLSGSYNIESGTLTIADSAFSYCTSLTSITIPDSVTSIDCLAFSYCTSLTSITIPDSVTSIGGWAFYGCTKLETFDFNATNCTTMGSISQPVFSGCTNLKNINIGNNVKTIPSYAFDGCNKLTSITIPDSVTSIGSYAFYNCESLTSITIPDSVTSIGSYAFRNCTSLTSITIPDSVTSIGDDAFSNCRSLTSITIPDSVTSIGSYAFYNCESLTSITIPDSVTSIGFSAFSGCTSLTSITIPDSVTSIGSSAFYNCESLTSITIPDSVTSIGNYAFSGCTSLTSITIPDSVTSIGGWAFYGCTKLETFDFNATNCTTMGSISQPVFSGCTNLKNINIGNNVKTIPSYAFDGCNKLTSITIPDSVTSIGDDAFSGCTSLEDVWYGGFKSEKKSIAIGSNNSSLTNATWHYKLCDSDHNYTLNGNCTCGSCGLSKAPAKPTLESKTNSSVTLMKTDGFEYSKDGTNWQTSNVFNNLSTSTTYTFYQRVKESTVAFESDASEGLSVTFKEEQASIPSAPIVSSFTDTTVTLIPVANCEYSKDGTTWQTSNVFDGLSSGTKYTFYLRYAETETHEASDKSNGTSITTDKAKQTLVPGAPTVQSFTASSITLNAVAGCEYSKNGTTWQSSNVFSGLSCGTEYTFYQRYKETSTTYVGKSSLALVTKTDKGTQTTPFAPTLLSETYYSITLTSISGYEYSRDGINWQISNVFTGLNPETNYIFYQRKAETDTHYASGTSSYLIAKTLEAPAIESIVITTMPSKQSYLEVKDRLDVSGGKITVYYNDDTSEIIDITADMVSGFDNTVIGPQTLTVTHMGFTDTYEIAITPKTLVSISLSTPFKTTYTLNTGVLTVNGGQLLLTYNNDTFETIAVKESMVSGFDNTKLGEQTLTIAYGGKTITLTIKIVEVLPGDINEDTEVNVVDLALLKKIVAGLQEKIDVDLNGDGKTDVVDLAILKKIVAGLA